MIDPKSASPRSVLGPMAFGLVTAMTFTIGLGTPVAAQDTLAIRGGTILPITAEPIEDGVILIRDGQIVELGPEVEIPIEAKVIDASERVILPGFIAVHTSEGQDTRSTNEVNPNVPFLSVVDGIDPSRSFFEESRRNGLTTAMIVPGNSTLIGGQGAVVKTAGVFVDDMLLKAQASIKLSLLPTRNASRMSQLATLRAELEKYRRYLDQLDGDDETAITEDEDDEEDETETSNGQSGPSSTAGSESNETIQDQDDDEAERSEEAESDDESEEPDVRLESMFKMMRGELPAFIYCSLAMDVPRALDLIEQYQLDAVLVLGRDCYKAVDLIAESGLPVVLDAQLVFWEQNPRTGDETKVVLPEIYREAGIPVTFQTGSGPNLGSSYLWYQAATAVKYGTDRDEALSAITLRPAQILGIDQFVGSIEPGKDADLIIMSGDPFEITTYVETTIIDGAIVYQRSEDSKLAELIRPTTDENP